MIIKIEDAPNIKHVKIDINFDEEGEATIVSEPSKPKQKEKIEVPLNLDEDFDISKEVVEKPTIPDAHRDVNVSADMKNAEF